MNTLTLMGRLGHDPSLKTLDSGTDVVEFSLATSDKRKQGDEWVDETIWHRVKFFGKRASALKTYVKKGDLLLVVGKQVNSKYEDKNGVVKYASEVIGSNFEFAGGGRSDAALKDKDSQTETWTGASSEVYNHAPGATNPPPSVSANDEMPF